MAQRYQLTGLLRRHDAGDACDAQHIAFFGRACGNDVQGGRLHGDEALRDRYAVGVRLGAYVDHMGLALGVEMGEFSHSASVFNASQAAIQGATCAVVLHHTCWRSCMMAGSAPRAGSRLDADSASVAARIIDVYMVF